MASPKPRARYPGAIEPTDQLSTAAATMLSSTERSRETTHSWAEHPEASPAETLVDGTLVDERYRIDTLLGSGGMGTVYRATEVDSGEMVALKAMLPRLAHKTNARLRFQREAKAILRLDHPNVVRILDHGELPPHTPYLVMDFLDGATLRERIELGEPIDAARALQITREVLEGLDHAHSRGVVHRDIKPENVFMVAQPEGPDQARILDLGLAKLVSSDDEGTPHKLTMRGAIFGTPAYMAPEQALGEEVDIRADLYSTTVMLYELLAGQRPFYANEPTALLIMHTRRTPPALADVAPALAPFEVLQELIDRGMAKTAGGRFQTAAEYIAAIDEALAELARTPLPPPPIPADESETETANSIISGFDSRSILDDDAEASSESRPVPLWLIVVLIALAVALVGALSLLIP